MNAETLHAVRMAHAVRRFRAWFTSNDAAASALLDGIVVLDADPDGESTIMLYDVSPSLGGAG